MVSASYVSKWSHEIMEMIEEKTLRAMKTFLIEIVSNLIFILIIWSKMWLSTRSSAILHLFIPVSEWRSFDRCHDC